MRKNKQKNMTQYDINGKNVNRKLNCANRLLECANTFVQIRDNLIVQGVKESQIADFLCKT